MTDESCRRPPAPSQGLRPRPRGEMLPSQPSTWLSAPPPHTPVGWHSAAPLAGLPSAPFTPHERLGVCVSGPRGGGRSWHLPLPSAVPGPEHGARRVLSDAALSASWCPAPRGASRFGVSICRGTLGFGEAVSPSASEPSWRKFFREPKRGTARFCSVREHPLSPAPEKWPPPPASSYPGSQA